jgi:hypothetical protein
LAIQNPPIKKFKISYESIPSVFGAPRSESVICADPNPSINKQKNLEKPAMSKKTWETPYFLLAS